VTEAELTSPHLQRHRRRLEVARAWLSAVGALAALAALVVSVTIATGNRANGQVIRDCVEPAGNCYKRNAARTEETLGRLVDLQVAVELCAREPGSTAPEIRACVRRAITPPR
jgi:type VI protein secretion system component VasK